METRCENSQTKKFVWVPCVLITQLWVLDHITQNSSKPNRPLKSMVKIREKENQWARKIRVRRDKKKEKKKDGFWVVVLHFVVKVVVLPNQWTVCHTLIWDIFKSWNGFSFLFFFFILFFILKLKCVNILFNFLSV